jgi:hypothetical protein
VREYLPQDQDLGACWGLVAKGIEVGWLDDDELSDLLEHLRGHHDFGVEELLFAHLGDRLRVSFLDDHATCSSSMMIGALAAVAASAGV